MQALTFMTSLAAVGAPASAVRSRSSIAMPPATLGRDVVACRSGLLPPQKAARQKRKTSWFDCRRRAQGARLARANTHGRSIPMMVLLLGLLLAAVVAFAGPTLLPQQFRNPLADNALLLIGIFGMLFAIASTSFVRVPDGHLGQLFRVYGG